MSVYFVNVRKSLGLTQKEFALLLGVHVSNVRNWEQGTRSPGAGVSTLYQLVEKEEALLFLVGIACEKKYNNIEDIKNLKQLIQKVEGESLVKSLFEVLLLKSNSHYTPEQLGLRVTRVSVK